MLRSWDRDLKIDEAGMRHLAARISRKTEQTVPSFAGEEDYIAGASAPGWKVRLGYGLIGALTAAMLLALLSSPLSWFAGTRSVPLESEGWMQAARILPEDARRNGELFREMLHLFPGRLQWIKAVDGSLDLGIDPHPTPRIEAAGHLMSRLVLISRSGEGKWNTVWATEVSATTGEMVRLPMEENAGEILFWTHLLPDGLFLVDTKIHLRSPVEVSAETGSILRPGEPQPLLSLTAGNVEYSLLQAVSALPVSGTKGAL